MRSPAAARRSVALTLTLLALGALPVSASARDVQETPASAGAQTAQDLGDRVEGLEAQVRALEERVESLPIGLVLILFGGFCALWAQNTGRSAWLWFVLGLLFNVFAMVAVLIKNPGEPREG